MTVGTSGSCGLRWAEVTASGRSFPDLMYGNWLEMLADVVWICPLKRSIVTSPEPL